VTEEDKKTLDEILRPNVSDEDIASETWVMLTGEDLLVIRKSINELKSELERTSNSGDQ
jgi:hypothetical protein